MKHFCRHLVVLFATYRLRDDAEEETERVYTCAGTVVCLGNQVLVMLAGHAAKGLKELVKDPKFSVVSIELADNFSDKAQYNHSIPLRISYKSIFAFDEDGLDFGFFILDSIQARLLPSNGIIAIDESQWRNPISRKLDTFFVLGVPSEFVDWSTLDKSCLKLAPSLVKLSDGGILPEIEQGKLFQRFEGTLPQNIGMNSFEGMSGGPIFGLSRNQPDKYWVVAIQESWKKKARKIYASPIHEIGKLVDSWLEDS